jgi:isopenicillin-N epimerase
LGSTKEDGARLRDALLFEHRIEVPVIQLHERLFLRISAQAYNDEADVANLADALLALLAR